MTGGGSSPSKVTISEVTYSGIDAKQLVETSVRSANYFDADVMTIPSLFMIEPVLLL